ncbi:MAG: hypothetical protein QXL20_01980 [Candidatus Bathyarchaeia archaeon]
MSKKEKSKGMSLKKTIWHFVAGGVFLISLAILFYFDFWSWILALSCMIVIIEGVGKYYSQKPRRKTSNKMAPKC